MAQEEERERRMDFVPEESAVNTDIIEACLSCLYFPYLLSPRMTAQLCHRADNSTDISHRSQQCANTLGSAA